MWVAAEYRRKLAKSLWTPFMSASSYVLFCVCFVPLVEKMASVDVTCPILPASVEQNRNYQGQRYVIKRTYVYRDIECISNWFKIHIYTINSRGLSINVATNPVPAIQPSRCIVVKLVLNDLTMIKYDIVISIWPSVKSICWQIYIFEEVRRFWISTEPTLSF